MAAQDTTAVVAVCSKCDGAFAADGQQVAAGVCATCPDGDSLCQKCVARHSTDARFKGHACRALDEVYAGTDFLARQGLTPALKMCPSHSQTFLGLRCTVCPINGALGYATCSLCAVCVKEHTLSYPTHLLAPFAPNVAEIRAQLDGLVAALTDVTPFSVSPTSGAERANGTCYVSAVQSAAVVESARRKALAAQTGLVALATNKEASLAQLEANRDAVIASAQECFLAGVNMVNAAAATKKAALEAELEAADAALSAAVAATAALVEVRSGQAAFLGCSASLFHLYIAGLCRARRC